MNIPTVTEDDLREFHRKHFPFAPAPPAFFSYQNAANEPDNVYENELEYGDEEDDGLGYYPDGVKRTLTDEQIAIFRHSEIQQLLKMLRQLKEDQDESQPAGRMPVEPTSTTPKTSSDGTSSNAKKNKKRKRKAKDAGIPPAEGVTYRRIAREMDEQKGESIELDY